MLIFDNVLLKGGGMAGKIFVDRDDKGKFLELPSDCISLLNLRKKIGVHFKGISEDQIIIGLNKFGLITVIFKSKKGAA